MKYFILFFLVATMACTPNHQEIWLDESGGGQIEMSYELGPMIKEFIQMMDEGNESKDQAVSERIDSIASFFDVVPDSIKMKMSNPDGLKKVDLEMKVDEVAGIYDMKVLAAFDNRDQLVAIFNDLSQAQSEGQTSGLDGMMGQGADLSNSMLDWTTDFDAGIVRIKRADLSKGMEGESFPVDEILGMIDSLEQNNSDEHMDAMMALEMFFGQKTRTTVHLPGKVWFTNDPNAKINGKTVSLELDPMPYLLEGKYPPSDDWIIKLKD